MRTLASIEEDVFSSAGEMQRILRAHDWERSPLGSVETWPQSLKTAVRIMLSSRFAMWMGWGPDLAFLYNDTYRHTLGKKHPWAIGKPVREVWSEEWKDVGPRVQGVLDTGEAIWDEGLSLFLERSGFPEETYHTFSYSPLHDDHGRIAGVLCVVTEEAERIFGERRLSSLRSFAAELDAANAQEESRIEALEAGADAHLLMGLIRRQSARERELLAETQRERNSLRELFLQAPAAIALLIGRQHRFALANERYLTIVGRHDEAELIGRPLLEALPELKGQPLINLIDRVYETGSPCIGNEQLIKYARGPNGELEDLYFNFIYQPRVSKSGLVEGVLVHAVDVTESVLARRAVEGLASSVQESESRLRAILNQVVSGICQVDLTGHFVFVNERYAEIVGRSVDELMNMKICDLVHKEDLPRGHQLFLGLIQGSDTYEVIERFVRPDGTSVWVQNNVSAVLDGNGRIQSAVCVTQDITERKVAQEALRRSEKLAAVGQLASTIAHEINNPLEAVTNLLYLMRGSESPEELKEYAAVASEELARVSHVVTTTLQFHRQPANSAPERISDILDSAVSLYMGRLTASEIEVIRDYHDESSVRCYSPELRQVFANIVGNAFDATRSSSRKKIVLRTRDVKSKDGRSGVRVTIADTGHGMSLDTRKSIYEPFFTTKGMNGTGLGLWVSLDILRKHDAGIQVRSSQEEGASGTVFSIFFPCDGDCSSAPYGQVAAETGLSIAEKHGLL